MVGRTRIVLAGVIRGLPQSSRYNTVATTIRADQRTP